MQRGGLATCRAAVDEAGCSGSRPSDGAAPLVQRLRHGAAAALKTGALVATLLSPMAAQAYTPAALFGGSTLTAPREAPSIQENKVGQRIVCIRMQLPMGVTCTGVAAIDSGLHCRLGSIALDISIKLFLMYASIQPHSNLSRLTSRPRSSRVFTSSKKTRRLLQGVIIDGKAGQSLAQA